MTTTLPAGKSVGLRRTALKITSAALPRHAKALLDNGFRLAMAATQDDGDTLRVVYLFTGADDQRVELHVPVQPVYPHVPSLARLSILCGRFEREMHDLYGIIPDDHPEPERLVRHGNWPKGWHPMRRDAGEPPEFGEPEVADSGLVLGPVHGALAEPGQFRLTLAGETVLRVDTRLWFVHRGLEKLFEGREPEAAIELAERIVGDTSIGHTLAFCLAVEDALGIGVPADARRTRAVLLELERVHNQVAVIGRMCAAAGHDILDAHAQRIRERLLRLNAEVTGHRLLRGAIRPGIAEAHPPDQETLTEIGTDIAEVVELALGHAAVRERFADTAVLTEARAAELGTAGGLAGDVLARFRFRAKEIERALAVSADPPDTGGGSTEPGGSGVGIVEGWRGPIVHRIELDAGTLTRVKVVDPSFLNWPALPVAAAGIALANFPLAVASFGLAHSGNDL